MKNQKLVKTSIELFFILLLALGCILLWCPPEKRPAFAQEKLKDYFVHYGLDIKGGSRLIYELDESKIPGKKSIEDVLERTKEIIEKRIDESNIVKEPIIQTIGENKISIQLPGVSESETERIKKQIETLGNLEFRLVAAVVSGDKATPSTKVLGSQSQINVDEEWRKYKRKRNAGGPVMEEYRKKLKEKGFWWFLPQDKIERESGKAYLLWIKDGQDYEGEKFHQFYTDFNTRDGHVVGFVLKDEHKHKFSKFMSDFRGERMAVVYNNYVVVAPTINKDRPPQGSGIIAGNFAKKEVEDMVSILRSGSLEIRPEFLQGKTTGARYGEDAIRVGIEAGIIGMILVALFMILYYRAAGVVAVIALTLNLLIIFAVLVITKQTLTLPGLAGIILTIGMSVDANIIIFERIREEQARKIIGDGTGKNGKKDDLPDEEELDDRAKEKLSLIENLDNGYQGAQRAIIDANITTLITAIILYWIASGPVEGFAFTLGVGIVASLFTAIIVTRMLFDFLIELRVIRKLKMMRLVHRPNFGFTARMKTFGLCSLVLIIAGMSFFFYRGTRNYGLDLRGGVEAHISLDKPLTTEQVRDRTKNLEELLQEGKEGGRKSLDAEIFHFASTGQKEKTEKGWRDYSITLPNLNQDAIDGINGDLRDLRFDLNLRYNEQKKFNNHITDKENKIKNAESELKDLERQDASESEFTAVEDQIKSYEAEVAEETKSLDEVTEKIEKLREKENKLIHEKKDLANTVQLRAALEKEFANELASPPFGKIAEIRWDNVLYYRLPVHLYQPVSVQFIKDVYEIGKKESDKKKKVADRDFLKIELGIKKYGIRLKVKENADIQSKLLKNLKKQFELNADISLSDKQIQLDKSESADWDYYVSLEFEKAVPEFLVQKVLESISDEGEGLIKKSELTLSGKDKEEIKNFSLFMSPTSNFSDELKLLSKDKRDEELFSRAKHKAEEIKGVEYKGQPTELSNPFPMTEQVSGAIAQVQKASAYRAIVLALLLILLYIAARFPTGLRFGSGAVLALLHDVLIALGVIAVVSALGIINVKITLPAIAALLTIVGYSLNDTIVIFDRIRENQKATENWDDLPQDDIAPIYDKSLNQTLSRTLLTSLTTLIVLGTIFVLNIGKATVMEGFSFILIVGVAVGTYSSLFIASPLVLYLEKRGREKRKSFDADEKEPSPKKEPKPKKEKVEKKESKPVEQEEPKKEEKPKAKEEGKAEAKEKPEKKPEVKEKLDSEKTSKKKSGGKKKKGGGKKKKGGGKKKKKK